MEQGEGKEDEEEKRRREPAVALCKRLSTSPSPVGTPV
jgi:hypothetical protein